MAGRRRSSQRGDGLVGPIAATVGVLGILITVLLIAKAFTTMYGGGLSANQSPPTRPGAPTTRLAQGVEKGQEVACRNNLRQIRDAIQMERTEDTSSDAAPASLESMTSKYGITPEMLKCPVTKQAYVYDAKTGEVHCPTPGHEAF